MAPKKAHPLAARIKRIMQKDEDVGKIAAAAPILISTAMELFLKKLCKDTSEIAAARGARTISASHLKTCVNGDDMLDFLKETLEDVPDLPPESEPKAKKQRTSADGVSGSDAAPCAGRGRGRRGRPPGPGRGRGRGRGRVQPSAVQPIQEEAPLLEESALPSFRAPPAAPADDDDDDYDLEIADEAPAPMPTIALQGPFAAAAAAGGYDDDDDYDEEDEDED